MKTIFAALGLAWLLIAANANAATDVVRYEDHGEGKRQVIRWSQEGGEQQQVTERSYPQSIAEHQPLGPGLVVELRGQRAELEAILEQRGVHPLPAEPEFFNDELITLVDTGDSDKRIDLVFMGDGYTVDERQKFIDDIQRMVNDMFEGETFRTYLPLFNVHAVFRPSNESGIGRNDRPNDTAYRLYRQGNTLRAIFPGNRSALRSSCRAAPDCDYPVVIANDPYYGGLGGEFAISTSSETSGTVVLRHELGHNFGKVGEEYDGGGYFGANWSSSVGSLKWRHWATDDEVRAEPSAAAFLSWPWHNLSSGPFEATFSSPGRYKYAQVRFSASGVNGGQMEISLDGEPLTFNDPGTDDRSFQLIFFEQGFLRGNRLLEFSETVNDGDNWVSSVHVHEFGEDYNFDDEFIGAFPVFNPNGSVAGYRPTHDRCLMRDMNSTEFCPVCIENNWLEFFKRIDLIDDLDVTTGDANTTVTLTTLKIGQFRDRDLGLGDEVQIQWFRNGELQEWATGLAEWTQPTADVSGSWEVRAAYQTPEIRRDSRDLTKDRESFRISASR